MGSTTDTTSYTSNTVTISHALMASQVANASDDLTGTLRVHKDNFAVYNLNIKNQVSFNQILFLILFSPPLFLETR
jgi:pectinesterase